MYKVKSCVLYNVHSDSKILRKSIKIFLNYLIFHRGRIIIRVLFFLAYLSEDSNNSIAKCDRKRNYEIILY